MELRGYIQTFDWGKAGEQSLVGRLTLKLRKLKYHSGTNLTELWIGTHVNGEARIRETKERLSEYIKRHPQILGISRYQFGDNFPLMLKVVSVATPLSIHIHPNERQALTLNKEFPDIYPDPVHKPELIIALTDLEVMVGFRPINEIRYFLENVLELKMLIKSSSITDYLKTKKMYYLKKVFGCLITTEKDKMTEVIDNYFQRMEKEDSDTKENSLFDIVFKLQGLKPYDNGVFAPFFLNHFTLKPEEAIYVPPMMPHSYLHGDAIQCSTSSDNIIRSALTSKYTDVTNFLEYADFKSYLVDELKVKPTFGPYVTIYDCEEDAFIVYKVKVSIGNYYTIYGKSSFCFFIIIQGTALIECSKELKTGTIILIPPCHTYSFKALENLVIYMAEPNLVI